MNVDLVFEGGGVLGINYVGTLKALEERGYQIQRSAGTSAGSVISALIIAGYTSKELIDILYNTDFKKFVRRTKVGKVPVLGGILSMLVDKGQYDSSAIGDFMNDILEKKGKTRFKHVMTDGKSRLKVVAADITKRKLLILPDNLVDYGVDPGEFSIAKAVEMSCSIPFYFTPVMLKYDGGVSYIVDGGLLSGFPIWIFDMEGTPQWPTIGIKIQDLDSHTSQGKNGIINYLKDIVEAPLNMDAGNFIHDKDYVRTIIISYDGKISATDFHKVNDYRENILRNGYNSTIKFLNSWDFRKYTQQFSK